MTAQNMIRPEITPWPSCLDPIRDPEHKALETVGQFAADAVRQIIGDEAEARLRAARLDPRATPEQRECAAVLQMVTQCWSADA